MTFGPITSWQIDGNSVRLYFLGLQNHCRWWLQQWNWKTLAPWKKSYDKHRQHVKKQRHHFSDKDSSSPSYVFSSSHVWMWELDHKEGWMPRNWCFQIMMLEKTLESPLDCKEIKPVKPKGYEPWIFIGRTDVEALIIWPPDGKSQLTGKDLNAGKDWRQKEKRVAEERWLDSITDSMEWTWANFGR